MDIFYLIRHPESDMNLNHAHLIGGRSNHTTISDKGYTQVDKLIKRLGMEGIFFDTLSSSPAFRTLTPAKLIKDAMELDVEIVVDDRLQELHQGDWEGRLRTEIYTPEMIKIIEEQTPNFKAPNGESQYEKGEDMLQFMQSLIDITDNKKHGILTHGIAIKCLLQRLLESKPQMTTKIDIENTSITIIRFDQGKWFIGPVGDHAHLNLL